MRQVSLPIYMSYGEMSRLAAHSLITGDLIEKGTCKTNDWGEKK